MNLTFYLPFAMLSAMAFLVRNRRFVVGQLILISIVLALFAGLRYGDNDYFGYKEIFSEVPTLTKFGLSSISEIHGDAGFLLVASFLKSIGVTFEIFLLVISVVSVSLIAAATKRLSYAPVLSMLFYYSHVFILREMMQIRAGLAVAIILATFAFSERLIKCSVGIIIAAFIHGGAVIVLPFYILVKDLNFKWSRFVLLFLLALVLSTTGIAKPTLAFLNGFGLVPFSVTQYIGWDLYDRQLATLTNPVTWKAFLILFLLRNFTNEELGPSLSAMRNLYAAGVLLLLCLSDFAILAGRLSTFLMFGEAILVSWAFLFRRNYQFWALLLIAVAFLQLTLDLTVNDVHANYEFYLFTE